MLLADSVIGAVLGPGAEAPRLVTRAMVARMKAGSVLVDVARTSTFALNNATIGHVMALADKGRSRALSDDSCLRAGLNICRGSVTYAAVASAHGYAHVPAEQVLT